MMAAATGWIMKREPSSIPKHTSNVYVHWYAENSLGSNQGPLRSLDMENLSDRRHLRGR